MTLPSKVYVLLVTLLLSSLLPTEVSAGPGVSGRNRKICGSKIGDILSLICRGNYNTRVARGVWLRKKRDISQECCYSNEGCSIRTLKTYCAIESPDDETTSPSLLLMNIPVSEFFAPRPSDSPHTTPVTTTASAVSHKPRGGTGRYQNVMSRLSDFDISPLVDSSSDNFDDLSVNQK